MSVTVEPEADLTNDPDQCHFRVCVPNRSALTVTVHRSTGQVTIGSEGPADPASQGGLYSTPEACVRAVLGRMHVSSSDVDEVVRQLASKGAFQPSK